MPICPWMYLPLWMPSWCNAVGVVLLIARGWRGTSLPRGNVRKGIQRHRCWAFFVKARLQWNILWRITLRKRNAYGVGSHFSQCVLWKNITGYVSFLHIIYMNGWIFFLWNRMSSPCHCAIDSLYLCAIYQSTIKDLGRKWNVRYWLLEVRELLVVR